MTQETTTASWAASGQFTKKSVTIDAWLIDFENKPLPQWVNDALRDDVIDWCPAGEGLYINTLEGHMLGGNGDWLIRGVKGEMYACKPDIFEATYTRAALAPSPAQPVAEPAKNDTAYADCICANCGDDKAQHNGSRCVNGDENSYFAAQQPGTAQADSVLEDACYAPPLGWRCTRKAGHEGPCAAVAYEDDKLFVERGMQRIRDAECAMRYRWLRDVGDTAWQPFALREGYSADITDKAIDTAIELARMKGAKE